jgi:Tfp pilus assembly protein PilO
MSQKKAVSDNQNLPLIADNHQIYLWKALFFIVLAFLAIQFILATAWRRLRRKRLNERGNVCTNEGFIKQRYSSTFERAYDRPTSSSMLSFMKKLALFLDCPVKSYSSNNTQTSTGGGRHPVGFVKYYL